MSVIFGPGGRNVVEGTTIKLYFGPNLIGLVSDTYYSEFNWYGMLHSAEGMPSRIRAFIAMCQDWHARLGAGPLPDADEFNPWAEVHGSTEWQTGASDGGRQRIHAPVFWPGGEICWRVAEDTCPDAAPDRQGR